jgi:hypothetical protein
MLDFAGLSDSPVLQLDAVVHHDHAVGDHASGSGFPS